CHRWGEKEILQRVESTQDKVREGRDRAERTVAQAHFDIAAAKESGASDEELAEARQLIRSAQMRWDYVAANNGMGFHSPSECLRVLSSAVYCAGQARVAAKRLQARDRPHATLEYPDYSTKLKAQKMIKAIEKGERASLLSEGDAP